MANEICAEPQQIPRKRRSSDAGDHRWYGEQSDRAMQRHEPASGTYESGEISTDKHQTF